MTEAKEEEEEEEEEEEGENGLPLNEEGGEGEGIASGARKAVQVY